MKKLISMLLVICMVCSVLAACGSGSGSRMSTIPKGKNSVPEAKLSDENGKHDSKRETELTDAPEEKEVSIEETVIYDENDIKITATKLKHGKHGPIDDELKFLVENNSEDNIAFTGDVIVVNGLTIPCWLYIDVAAGKKSNGSLSLAEAHNRGIDELATITGFDTRIVNTDTYGDIDRAPFDLVTSLGGDYIQEFDESGDVIYDEDGITVISQLKSDAFFGESVQLFVKNGTDCNFVIQAENVSVNGFTIGGWLYDVVYSDTARYSSIDLMADEMEENDITEVEEVSFTLQFTDPETFDILAESDELTLYVSE